MTAPPPPGRRIRIRDIWPEMAGTRRSLGYVLLLSALLQIFVFLSPLQMQLVIDQAITAGDRRILEIVALSFLVLHVVQSLTEFIRSRLQILLSQAMSLEVMTRTVQHLSSLPLPFFEGRSIGDIASRAGASRTVQDIVVRILLSAGLDALMAITALAVMLSYSVILTLVVLLGLAIVTVVQLMVFPIQRRLAKTEIEARATEQTQFLENLRSMTAIRLHGLERRRGQAWAQALHGSADAGIKSSNVNARLQLFRTIVNGAQSAAVIYLGARAVISGSGFTLGMLVAYLAYRGVFVERFNTLLGHLTQVRFIGLHLDRVSDILGQPRGHTATSASDHGRPQGAIEVRKVTFAYPDGPPVLTDLDLTVPQGGFVAVEGASGGGKSTLLKLMLGLYTPDSGEIAIGGRVMTGADWPSWRSRVGVVGIDDRLFAGSIADNITLFSPDADEMLMARVAEQAGIDREIRLMPNAYRTEIGELAESISAGQRQRLLLARALYRQPDVLILDEGTANLDEDNERSITDLVSGLTMTRLVVAHRPALLEAADIVYRLHAGRLRPVAKASGSASPRIA
ncbi:peptidase domain-containing ABC transporter [Brevundimonas sp. BAL450]|uniref:peptidase domain-containing ABC transporter n=1 Tax=Brevundimonas sp. BAL450 TaxID=1708162 RepID=UPI0018C93593|nr:peptidase domain-containing ABC transporter [Brevundimonas sp. BAL450]MBG7613758.1 peptidase domain-containing ABC transporter [Brevundimonas sp. BAL450]